MDTSAFNIRKITSDENGAGKRLDIYISDLTGISRTSAKKAISLEGLEINKQLVKRPNYILKVGDTIALGITSEKLAHANVHGEGEYILPEDISLNILWENTDLLIINKPEGIVVHPAPGHYTGTLANGIKYYLQRKGEDNFSPAKVGLVHRLDAPTSGLLLVAKTPTSLDYLSAQFANRTVVKYYLALVKGKFPQHVTADFPLGRDRHNRQKFSSRETNSKLRNAHTEFILLTSTADLAYSLVLAKPYTGRTHQIRVHLANLGFPIVGDATYGGEKAERLYLHAFALRFSPAPRENSKLVVANFPESFSKGLLAKGIQPAILRNALEEKLASIKKGEQKNLE